MIISKKGNYSCNGNIAELLADLAVILKATEFTFAEKVGCEKAKKFIEIAIEDYEHAAMLN